MLNWLANYPFLAVAIFLWAIFAMQNFMAFMHARNMTHFAKAGERAQKAEHLNIFQKLKVLILGSRIPRPVDQAQPEEFGLEYETHKIPSEGDIVLEAWYFPKSNNKGMVVLYHGWAISKGSMLENAKTFHESGYEVLLVDFRGSGGSNKSYTGIGALESEDVVASIKYAEENFKPKQLNIFAVSLGATAVMRACSMKKISPHALIIEAPFASLLEAVRNRFRIMGIPSFPSAELMVFWGGTMMGFNAFAHRPVDYAKKIEIPTLVMSGQLDRRVDTSEIDGIYNNLAGEKRMEIFEQSSHESLLNSDPEKWRVAVEEFFEL